MIKRISKSSKVIAITMGDPQGIGPEVIQKALKDCVIASEAKQSQFIVVGDKKLLKKLPSQISVITIPYKSAGEGSLKFLDKAIDLIKGGVADALVTAPLSKESVSHYSKNFVGHTEYLAESFQVKQFDMMFVAPNTRLTIVTRHVPLKEVTKLITKKTVFDSISLMDSTLKSRFRIKAPRIAVLGLNPHAGEGGLLGTEDVKHIVPAIAQAKAEGIKAFGPFPADTFFAFNLQCHCERSEAIFYDGVIAMYHDQGLAPLKGLYMKELVNFTAGLPFVRTSPAHGTAYDIVGKNIADPSSMKAAIELACDLA